MGKTAILIGATGLTGNEVLNRLLNHPEFNQVRIFTRKSTHLNHPKLEEILIDFDQTESWRHLVKGDVLISSLGTTIKTAKTKENQYRVDFTYQYEFAKAASENGIQTYILVSSMGANPKSKVFYSRMKGELEEAVADLAFKKLVIIRPSILDGKRRESRPGERIGLKVSRFLTRFFFRNYRPTPIDILANKIIRLSLDGTSGYRIIEGTEIFR